MKYIEKYNRYIDNDCVIYRKNKEGKLVQVKPSINNCGYITVSSGVGRVCIHRIIYEAFIGEIPDGYEIDHINTIRDDNRLENLRLVTRKENLNNALTIKHIIEAHKGQDNRGTNKGKIHSDFGRKFFEHTGLTRKDNIKFYKKEWLWFHNHNNICRWE